MVILRRIGIRSAGNLGFWVGLAFGLINFFIFMAFVFFVGHVPLREIPMSFFFRVAMALFFGSMQSAFTFGMFAFVYNRVAQNTGGLQLEFSDPVAPPPPPYDKPKTGDAEGEEPQIF